MELVTIKSFDNPVEAHILRTKLESEGITVFIFDENMILMYPFYNQMLGGVKLKVPEVEVEKALQIIAELDKSPFYTGDDQVLCCPNCGSTELYSNIRTVRGKNKFWGFLGVVLAFFLTYPYPPYFNQVYRCKKCGKEFENK